jgi:hypothetical protein
MVGVSIVHGEAPCACFAVVCIDKEVVFLLPHLIRWRQLRPAAFLQEVLKQADTQIIGQFSEPWLLHTAH